MFSLIAASAKLLQPHERPQEPRASVQSVASVEATATVRIERAGRASSKDWEQVSPSSRHELIIKGEAGDPILLRVVDFQ